MQTLAHRHDRSVFNRRCDTLRQESKLAQVQLASFQLSYLGAQGICHNLQTTREDKNWRLSRVLIKSQSIFLVPDKTMEYGK